MKSKLTLLAFLSTISILLCNGTLYASNDPVKHSEEMDIRTQLVMKAKEFLGTTYVFGGCSTSGFDCSGLTQTVFATVGIEIERNSGKQAQEGNIIATNELKAGDLLFFGNNNEQINHVAIVIRNSGRNLIVIHSTSSGGVMLDDVHTSSYWKKKMIYGVDVLSNIF